MPRFLAPIAAVALVLVGLLAAGRLAPLALAQEGTPTAEEEFELPEGLTFEPLASGTTTNLPAARIDFELFRLRLEPGVAFQAGEDDPSLALVYVEAGALTAVVAGPMTVLRAAGPGTPFPEATEAVPAGEEFTLGEGDSALFPPGVDAEVRNDGSEPVMLLVAETSPAAGGEEEAATPVP